MGATIGLNGVNKRYGAVEVLQSLTLDIADGSFTALLGASGCGKTTLLNLIAGLDAPSGGEIAIGGETVHSAARRIAVPAQRRNIGYVFQSYALWPHMRVVDNVAYPLRVRGTAKAERHRAAQDILQRLELGELGARFPFELSGGQQQRVAIARALIYRPKVLLLDEPLSNLDVQLRERARAWIAKVHAEFGLTTVLVTHDHAEALSMSDRVVLLRAGRIEQDGSAREIFEHPRTAYVADFLGGANSFAGRVATCTPLLGGGCRATVRLDDGTTLAALSDRPREAGDAVRVIVRPRRVEFQPTSDLPAGADATVVPIDVTSSIYRGNDWELVGTALIGELRIVTAVAPAAKRGFARLTAADCRCVDP